MSILKYKIPSDKEKVLAEIAKRELGLTLKVGSKECDARAVERALHLAYEAGKKK